jgi:uncharacterized protein YndB with AHSA1/START domain
MPTIRVSTVIDAPPARVWSVVRDIADHVSWMEDAVAIRFTSPSREGAGTTYECDTAVGPFRLTDVMEITEWKARKAMGVRHVGVVTGWGVFTLTRVRGRRTRFTWKERLRFPWWMGGPVGALVGGQLVMRRIWHKNLANLKARVEGS